MKPKFLKSTVIDQRSYLWLSIGFIFSLFSNGKWSIPIAVWISLVFMLRFVRTQKPLRGYLISGVAFFVTYYFSWNSAFSFVIPYFAVISIIAGFLGALPFLIDRLIYHRFNGVVSTLVFPITWTTFEFFNSYGMAGTWGSLAYTQYGNLPFMQLASITGIFGIVFLITWFASAFNLVWERDFNWLKSRTVIGIFLLSITSVLFLGGARLTIFPPESKTVRIVSITIPDRLPTYTAYKETQKLPSFEDTLKTLESTTRKAVQMEAKILFWQEFAYFVSKENEARFIHQAELIAKKYEVYLLVPMVVFGKDNGVNKAFFLTPSGETEFEYIKRKPVRGIETSYIIAGQKKPSIAITPYGRISSVICADLDFPGLLREIGKDEVDILLGPALDWKGLDPMHSRISVFRAIENGFSLIRSNGGGLSISTDFQGRTISGLDVHTSQNRIMISDIPIKGVTTLYSKTGDIFAWLCVLGLVSFFVRLILLRWQKTGK